MKGRPAVSEDDIKRQLADLEKVTDEFMNKITVLGKEKEGELVSI